MGSIKLYVSRGAEYALIALIFSLMIFVLLKISLWRKKELDKRAMLLRFAALWYFITLEMVIFWGRNNNGWWSPATHCNLYLFENILDAIRGSGWEVIVQVVLNLLMFVPGGFLLGLLFDGKKKTAVPLTLLGIILFNETVQFFTGLGAADIDDLFTNMLGGLWGYAVWRLFQNWKMGGRRRLISALAVLLPVLAAAGGLVFYQLRPWGYLPQDVVNFYRLKAEKVTMEGLLPETESLSVYMPGRRERQDAVQAVERIFAAVDEKPDLRTEDAYDTVAVFRGENAAVYIWYYYRGVFTLHLGEKGYRFSESDQPPQESMRALLSNMGFVLPEPTEVEDLSFEKIGLNRYRLWYDFVPMDGRIYDGTVEFSCAEDGNLTELSYNVMELTEYCRGEAIDETALTAKLRKGLFSLQDIVPEDIDEIICQDFRLGYTLDSKGYYRPVYSISCLIDGQEAEIIVSAIK